jgi:hypothetical protein
LPLSSVQCGMRRSTGRPYCPGELRYNRSCCLAAAVAVVAFSSSRR